MFRKAADYVAKILKGLVLGIGVLTGIVMLLQAVSPHVPGVGAPLFVAGALKHGETDERMHLLNAWRETPLYTARERAALAWAEAITLLSEGHVPDDIFETVRNQFSEKEIVDLTAAAVAINTWNRLSIAFRVPPQVDTKKAAA